MYTVYIPMRVTFQAAHCIISKVKGINLKIQIRIQTKNTNDFDKIFHLYVLPLVIYTIKLDQQMCPHVGPHVCLPTAHW